MAGHVQGPIPEDMFKHLVMRKCELCSHDLVAGNGLPDLPWIVRIDAWSWIPVPYLDQATGYLARHAASSHRVFFGFGEQKTVIEGLPHGGRDDDGRGSR
ncbi:hypothetical protein SADUNF_Sadunf10G0137500 [Salix dunnii]|uniref:Uncharacterized protein n=1 Tax=Salix dunnii TaxID=1413687 RepID=A0A835JU25_9ROSI|nr:hypothetical protein SADUNF_Sadunf10G0137500 [Salix dunnii]